MKKHRSTVFTRMLFFLLIFTPIAYIGVMFSQGKNPVDEVKNLINKTTDKTNYSKTSEELTIEMQRSEIENLKKELKMCKEQK